jgi:hypothetical protein
MQLEDQSSSLYVVCLHFVNTFSCIVLMFSMKGGVGANDAWPPSVGNSWRTTSDIRDYWGSMMTNIDAVGRCG